MKALLSALALLATACTVTTRAGHRCGSGGCAPPLRAVVGGPDDMCTCEHVCRTDRDCRGDQYCVHLPEPDALANVCEPWSRCPRRGEGSLPEGVLLDVEAPVGRGPSEPGPDLPDEVRDRAHEHYAAGIRAASEDRWADAREAFQRAYDLAPFAPVLFNLSTSNARTGRIVRAVIGYRRFLQRPAHVTTPALRGDARALLDEAIARLARVTIAPSDRHDSCREIILLDGAELPVGAIGVPLYVDPGSHELAWRPPWRSGQEALSRIELTVSPGEERTVSLSRRRRGS